MKQKLSPISVVILVLLLGLLLAGCGKVNVNTYDPSPGPTRSWGEPRPGPGPDIEIPAGPGPGPGNDFSDSCLNPANAYKFECQDPLNPNLDPDIFKDLKVNPDHLKNLDIDWESIELD